MVSALLAMPTILLSASAFISSVAVILVAVVISAIAIRFTSFGAVAVVIGVGIAAPLIIAMSTDFVAGVFFLASASCCLLGSALLVKLCVAVRESIKEAAGATYPARRVDHNK